MGLHLLHVSRLKPVLMELITSSKISNMEHQTLLERVQQMDGQALADMHNKYYPYVYRYVGYRLDDTHAVEDISSEVFLLLLNALQRSKGPLTNLKGWLLGTAAHLVQDHLRSKYRRQEDDLEDHENISASNHTEQEIEHLQERKDVQRAFQTLTSGQQHVLALRFSQELSIEETAQMMGKRINSIKVLQFRALAALRRQMK